MTATSPTAVLIVDDEPDHAFIARRVLLDLAPGVEVEVVSARAGLEELLLGAPQGALVLLDRLLGGIETYPALEVACTARPDLRIALLSAWLTPEEGSRARTAGAYRALEKPGTLQGWRDALRELLEG